MKARSSPGLPFAGGIVVAALDRPLIVSREHAQVPICAHHLGDRERRSVAVFWAADGLAFVCDLGP